MIKFNHDMEEARRITVDIEGGLEKYAISFLNIFNNVREYPNMMYKVENTYDNRVFVTCPIDHVEEVKEYLEQFGEILEVEKINKVNIFLNYDYAKDFDTLYPDDCDTEFFVADDY